MLHSAILKWMVSKVVNEFAFKKDTLPLYFNGWKHFLHIRKPSQDELKSLPVYEAASPLEYEPRSRKNTRRLTKDQLKRVLKIGAKGWVTPPLRPQRKLLLEHPKW